MNKKNKTRQERLQFRRNVASGIAWILLCIIVTCGCNIVAENMVSHPMGIYAEEVK